MKSQHRYRMDSQRSLICRLGDCASEVGCEAFENGIQSGLADVVDRSSEIALMSFQWSANNLENIKLNLSPISSKRKPNTYTNPPTLKHFFIHPCDDTKAKRKISFNILISNEKIFHYVIIIHSESETWRNAIKGTWDHFPFEWSGIGMMSLAISISFFFPSFVFCIHAKVK